MQLTSNYKLKKPDYADTVDVQDLNGNADKIDAELSKKLDKTGEGGDLTVSFTQGPGKVNLTPGEKLSISLGKIMKWLSEMKAVAVTGNYNDLSNRLFVANNDTTTAGGFVADARIVKQHGDEIDQLRAQVQKLAASAEPDRTYLYKDGNEYTNLTGGWVINNTNLMYKNQYSMLVSGAGTWQTGWLYTAYKVPITANAKILHIRHTGTGPAGSGAYMLVGVGSAQTTLSGSISVPSASGYIQDLIFNLQGYVGQSVYIIFTVYTVSSIFTGNVISEIYLTQ